MPKNFNSLRARMSPTAQQRGADGDAQRHRTSAGAHPFCVDFRKSRWLPMAEPQCELKAAAFGVTTRGTRCHLRPVRGRP